jgi:predicted nucleic acid-binding protein
MIAIDSSIALAWCFGDERTPAINAVESMLVASQGVVPVLWRFEVANVLLMAERRKRITSERRQEYLHALAKYPLEIDTDGLYQTDQNIFQLAVAFGLTIYDASYLELSIRRNLPLATLDKELRTAALANKLILLPDTIS